jgi:hypothetical protein
MADAALSLTLGPSTARLDISAAASGRSKMMAIAALVGRRLTPPPLAQLYPLAVSGVQPFDLSLLALVS